MTLDKRMREEIISLSAVVLIICGALYAHISVVDWRARKAVRNLVKFSCRQ